MEALTKRDFLRFLAVTKKAAHRDWIMFLIQFWHGGRASEIVALTRDNFVGSRIKYTRGKGSRPCDQQLVEHANPLLNEREAVFAFVRKLRPKQKLFPISRWTYRRRFLSYCESAQIDPGVLENNATRILKHCLGTYLMENRPANVVQRRLGHVNGANTLRYAELRESQVDPQVSDGVGLN